MIKRNLITSAKHDTTDYKTTPNEYVPVKKIID